MTRIFILISSFIFSSLSIHAQEEINWLSWDEAMEKSKTEKRKFVVDVYTDWCGWCKKMDKTTFSDPQIVKYVNENYYPIKFDAEHKDNIMFEGQLYKFVKGGKNGYHELASKILQGRLSFPTVVFLDEQNNLIQPIPGFQDVGTFNMIINYFAGDHFKSTPWPKFTRSFQPQAIPVKN